MRELFKTAFGDNSVGRAHTFEWSLRFRHGETSVEGCELLGYHSTGRTDESVEKICRIVNEDQQSTILEIAGRLGLLYGTCLQILREDLNMRLFSMTFVHRLLTDEQKQQLLFVGNCWMKSDMTKTSFEGS
jgi:hypothetical protein